MRTLLCLLLSTLGLVNALQVSAAPVSPYADFPPVKATSTNTVATIHVHVSGLEEGDKAVLSISSNEYLDAVEINAPGDFTFANVPAGEHTVGLKADGYTVSNALTVEVTSDGTVKPYTTLQFAMTKDSKESDDFHFVWEEDGTVAGYTTSANVNKPIEIDFLGKAIVPADVPSQHNLLSYFQILLADDELPWTEEYAYRLWQTMQTFEIAANDNEPGYKSDRPVSKFILTSELLPDDMTITDMGDGNKIVKVSKDAFAYANPYYVSIEGVKGRFFSKRLHHAMTKYVTDYGRDTDKANEILMRRFGCMVQGFDYEEVTAGITNEPADHFQMFKSSELVALINMMEEMPVGMHKIPQLKYLLRRLDTHTHPIYPGAAAVSWTTENGYIEFMEMAFGGNNEHFDTQRLILHEKSHFIWAFILNDDIKSRWIELGQWYENPNSSSGWSTTDQTGFVSSYAHDVNPDEDMAESIGYYLKDPEWLKSRNTSKYEFIRDYVMHGTRYISQIPDQFTFEVFNLWPDYDYPGKIIKIEVSTSGNADEDKIVTVDVWLNHIEGCQDGALNGWTRIFSPEFIDQDGVKKSHCADLGLCAVDGDLWHLRGTAFVSKHHKSGDWTAYTISLTDDQGNARFSSSDNDYVWKLWINNSDEDLWTPKYVPNSLKLDIYDSKDDFGHDIQVLHPTFLAYDDRIITGCYLGIGVKDEAYSKGAYGGLVDPSNPKGGLLEATLNINPFDHTAEYFVGSLAAYDKVNGCWVLFPDHEPIQSIMVTTPDPDTTYPEIDLNRVAIYAEPTNPEAPNGETRVTISMFVRDDKSGVESGSLTLRDPQGGQFTFGIPTPQSGNIYWDGDPYEWTYITANCTLAAGSAPGIWGLAEITLSDYALNERTFNLVETLIFEPDDDESNYVLFADMNENNMLSIHLESNEGSTFGFNYRIIHEATGEEISGDQSSKAPYKSAPRDKATVFTVDTSSLPDGDLIVIANVYDESGTPLAAKSCRVEKKPTIILGDVNKDGIIDGVDLNVMIVGVVSPEISTLTPASADMNNDGVINGLDINMLITNIINNQK